MVANTEGNTTRAPWQGFVLVDLDSNESPQTYKIAFSNKATTGSGPAQIRNNAVFWDEAAAPAPPRAPPPCS